MQIQTIIGHTDYCLRTAVIHLISISFVNTYKRESMAKINRENIADHLVDYQLGMIGKSTQEAHMTKEWYDK